MKLVQKKPRDKRIKSCNQIKDNSQLSSRLLEIVDHFLHRKNDPLKADRALRKIVAEDRGELSPSTVQEAERMIEVFMRSYF